MYTSTSVEESGTISAYRIQGTPDCIWFGMGRARMALSVAEAEHLIAELSRELAESKGTPGAQA